MSTFLFDKIVFGPVQSRRLGVSLGVNLLPLTRKICNFDCCYCECGMNDDHKSNEQLPTRGEVIRALSDKLEEMNKNGETLDVITFAGNGEPTIHPLFPEIINDTIALRNKWFPEARVSVLSNSTMIHKPHVFEALQKVDQNILKLDSAFMSTVNYLNKPDSNYKLTPLVENLKKFKGNVIIQSMFTRGPFKGQFVDNTTNKELKAWKALIKEIAPKEVMIYTVDRDTPFGGMKKIPKEELEAIGQRLSNLPLKVSVYA